MKRLMVMMTAAVVGACAWATDFTSSVMSDIADKTKGDTNIVGYDSDGKKVSESGSDVHWWAANWKAEGYEQPAVVSNDTAKTGEGNYLAVETEPGYPLLRSFSKVTEKDGETGVYETKPVDIADHGLFIDTKVKFTGTDTAPTIAAGNQDKLLVWLKVTETEGAEGDADYVAGVTNLMVTCGYEDQGVIVPTSYVLNAAIDPAKWYQLTIRADKDTVDNIAKFKIYLDGTQLKTVDGLAVFPSLVSGGATLTLATAGFEGTGFINSVDLLTAADAPAFAKDPTYLTLAWDENVASITIGGKNVIDGQTSPYALPIETFGADIAATIAYAPNYRKDSITQDGLVDYVETANGATFKVTEYTAPSLTVASVIDRNEATLLIGGEPVAAAGTLLESILGYLGKLEKSEEVSAVITLSDNASLSGLNYLEDFEGELTVDLKGYTIKGTAEEVEEGEYLFMPACVMTIKDSVGGGAIIAPAGAGLAFFGVDATIEKAAAGEITFTGAIVNDCWEEDDVWSAVNVTIKGGKFTVKPTTGKEGHLDDGIIIPEGKEWKNDGTYWTLVDKSAPEQKGFKIIISETEYEEYDDFAGACSMVTEGQTIQVLKNIDGLLEVPTTTTVSFTLDLNGKTVTADTTATIKHNGTGTLTITGNGTVINTANAVNMGIAVWARSGSVVIENGTFQNASTYEATIYIGGNTADGKTITINGGTFKNTATSYAWRTDWNKGIVLNAYNTLSNKETAFVINGGSFSMSPAAGDDSNVPPTFLAETKAAKLVDGLYVVVDAVAKIGNIGYASLADAVAVGGEIKLITNVSEKMTVPAGKTITLDLNGFTLQNAVAGYTIDNAGALTIVDSAETKGTITHLTADTSSTIRNLGTLVISDITVGGTYIGIKNDEGAGCNGGKGYGELTLNGVTFNGDDQAVQNWGKATINGGTFGGAVFTWADKANEGNEAGETIINAGTFNANVAAVQTYRTDLGWPSKKATVTVKGGTFEAKVYGTYTLAYTGEDPERGVIVIPATISEEINVAKFKVQPSVTLEEGYEFVEKDGYYVIQAKAPDAPFTPPTGGGTIEPTEEPGVYVVEPDPSSGNVTIAGGLSPDDVIRVESPADMTITGVPAEQIEVKINGTVIPNSAFVGDPAGADVFSTELKADAIVEIDNEEVTADIPVTPTIGEEIEGIEIEEPFVAGDTTSATVAAIPGLTYELKSVDLATGTKSSIGEGIKEVAGDDAKVTLTDPRKGADKPAQAFYVIEVTK